MTDAPVSAIATSDDDVAIKVCVRVRPFIHEEISGQRSGGKLQLCIKMPTKTSVEMIGRTPEPKSFEFDRCYWSHSEDHPNFADQDTLYEELGKGMLVQALKGFNNCIFAYGQTGSGKSYSVLGGKSPKEQGLLPRIVTGLFQEFAKLDEKDEKKCMVSFVEIYNEQIMDLLIPGGSSAEIQKLEVRQHPTLGTFIPGLTESPVVSEESVMKLVDYGTTMRHVSATAMNATSSRSHCIFSFKTSIVQAFSGQEKYSQTHLVDLAGSERAGRTKAEGARLKEGAAINQSLSTLARVISDLAKLSQAKGDKKKGINPPFRDSKITYILKESLSGNSKTVMMAAISPSIEDYEETLSTMKFCQTVKMVQTSAKKNEVNKQGLEEQLRQELQLLKEQLEKCEAAKEIDHRKMSLALKNLQAQKDLVSKNCSSWDEQLNMENMRQSKREAMMIADDEALADHIRRMTHMSAFNKDDSSDGYSEHDIHSEALGDGGISKEYEKIQELAKDWDVARSEVRATIKRGSAVSVTQRVFDNEDPEVQQRIEEQKEAEQNTKERYANGLREFRSRVQDEIDRLQSLRNEVDERWEYLHGSAFEDGDGDGDVSKGRTWSEGYRVGLSSRFAEVDDMSSSEEFLRLQRQANIVKMAVDAISESGAPELKLRVLVVTDPSSSERDVCVQAASLPARARQFIQRGSVMLDVAVDRDEFPKNATELLTGKDLSSRWAWLEDRCIEMAESKDETSEESVINANAAFVDDLQFVPRDGKKYVDPWREMSISCLRRDLKNVGQQLMSNSGEVRGDSDNAERRDETKKDKEGLAGIDFRKGYSFGTSLGIGIGASFDEATSQIGMAHALLDSLRPKKGMRGSTRRKNASSPSPSRSVFSSSGLKPQWT